MQEELFQGIMLRNLPSVLRRQRNISSVFCADVQNWRSICITYKNKTKSEPKGKSDNKTMGLDFQKTEKEFSLIDSNVSPLRKMGLSSAAAPNRTGLSDKLKSGVENLSGYSLDGVKVHYNSPKPAQFSAAAYTAGKNIFVGPGHESSLPHEAWHVVQQMKGEVSATNNINGVNVNENPALEREADIMGKKALSQTDSSELELISAEPRSDVDQFDHVINLSEPKPAVSESLKNCPHPMVVFECPIRFQNNYDEIYKQSLTYKDRNTICVFGVNSKDHEDFKIDTTNPPDGAGTESTFSHLAYYCTFNWTEINEKYAHGYPFPAVEARQAVANAAKKITGDIVDSNKQRNPGKAEDENDLSKTFVYRWLDEDSREEYTPELSKEIDALAKKDEVALKGGTYDWRIEADDMSSYHQSSGDFLNDLNIAEETLRNRFVILANKYKNIEAKDELVGCYVPESTVMMNQSAHNWIAGDLTKKDDGSFSAKGGLTKTLSAGGKTADYSAQDKESAKAMSKLRLTVNKCITPAIKTTKPVKFQKGDSGKIDKSYLGKEFFEAISSNKEVEKLNSKEAFYKALKAVRQSVFDPDHWFFEKIASDWAGPSKCNKDSINNDDEMNRDPIHCVQLAFNANRRNMADILYISYVSKFLSGKPVPPGDNPDDKPDIPYYVLGRMPDAEKYIKE